MNRRSGKEASPLARSARAAAAGCVLLTVLAAARAEPAAAGSSSTLTCLLDADFESGLQGFTIDNGFGDGNGLWRRAQDCEATLGDHTRVSALHFGRAEFWCDYDAGVASEGVVRSPVVSLGDAIAPVELTFSYFLETEASPDQWDQASVEVSVDGGDYVTVAHNDAEQAQVVLADPSAGWQTAAVDLSWAVGSDVRIRIRFRTFDDIANDHPGFYVDDVRLSADSPPPCEPPGAPTDPVPADGATSVPVATALAWTHVVCLDEDFDDQQAQGWQETTDAQWEAVAGEYRARHSGGDAYMQSVYAGFRWPDVSASVTIRQTGRPAAPAILWLRASDDFHWDPGQGDAYGVGITGDGRYWVGRMTAGEATTLHDWTSSALLHTDGAPNRLSVVIAGSRIEVHLNGEPQLELVDPAIAAPGRIGLGAHTLAVVPTAHYFDDITVCDAPPAGERASSATPRAAIASAEPCETCFDVYLGPAPDGMVLVGACVPEPSFVPAEPLAEGITYKWQVAAVNAVGTTPGPVWSFTTEGSPCGPPPTPDDPTPAPGADGVATDVQLTWAAGGDRGGATVGDVPARGPEPCPVTWDVYLGTDPDALDLACEGLGEPACDPTAGCDRLQAGTTFHWQVCCSDAFETVCGPVWSFTTEPARLIAWRSLRQHDPLGQSIGPTWIPIALGPVGAPGVADAPVSEPRIGGVQRIEVAFNQPAELLGAAVARDLSDGQTHPAGNAELDACGTSLTLDFAPGELADQRCYEIDLAGVVRCAGGEPFQEGLVCVFRALEGDTDNNGSVELADAILAFDRNLGDPRQAANTRFDVDVNGSIELADAILAFDRNLHKAECP